MILKSRSDESQDEGDSDSSSGESQNVEGAYFINLFRKYSILAAL